MKETSVKAAEALIEKSKEVKDSNDALRFSQAALNVMHVLNVFNEQKKKD